MCVVWRDCSASLLPCGQGQPPLPRRGCGDRSCTHEGWCQRKDADWQHQGVSHPLRGRCIYIYTIIKVLMKPKDETHLYLASIPATGNSDILSELLSHLQPGQLQLGVNQQSATGWSPLLFAAHKGHLAAVHILLEHVSTMIQPPKRFIESDGL